MNQVDELRQSVTQYQRELLDTIWRYCRTNDRKWMPSRLLHHLGGGPSAVRPELEMLGRAVAWEDNWNISDNGPAYVLPLLGVL